MVLPEFNPDTGPVGRTNYYDNIYEAWKDWMEQFQNFMQLNKVTKNKHNYFLEAAGKLFKKQFMLNKFGDDFDTLVHSLGIHFKKKKSLNVVRFNMLRSFPESGESDGDWMERLKDQIHQAEFEMLTTEDILLLILVQNTSNDALRSAIIERELSYEAALRWLKNENNAEKNDDSNSIPSNVVHDPLALKDSDIEDFKDFSIVIEDVSNIEILPTKEEDLEVIKEHLKDNEMPTEVNIGKKSSLNLEDILNSNHVSNSQKLLNSVNEESNNQNNKLVTIVTSLNEDGQFDHKAIETDLKFDITNARNRINVKMKCEFCKVEHVVRKKFRPKGDHFHKPDPYFSEEKPRASCEECSETFHKHADIRNHAHSAPNRQFKCSDCPKSYDSLNQLRAHLKVFEKKMVLKCPYCPNVSSSKHAYEKHKRNGLHKNKTKEKKGFFCDVCKLDSKEFPNKWQLYYHKEKFHRTKPKEILRCNYCDHTTKCKANLRIHTKKQHINERNIDEEKHLCTICAFSATSRKGLLKHEKTHRERKKELCPLCGSSVQDVKNHINESHTKIGSFPCNVCGKIFARQSGIKQHMRVHLELEQCEVCNAGVRSVVLHMKTAHGVTVKKPKCPECNKEFVYKYILDQHVEKFHLKHHCSECGKDFPSKTDLSNHVFFEHRKMKYECLICGEAQIDIWRHLKQKHDILAKTGIQFDGKYKIIKCAVGANA